MQCVCVWVQVSSTCRALAKNHISKSFWHIYHVTYPSHFSSKREWLLSVQKAHWSLGMKSSLRKQEQYVQNVLWHKIYPRIVSNWVCLSFMSQHKIIPDFLSLVWAEVTAVMTHHRVRLLQPDSVCFFLFSLCFRPGLVSAAAQHALQVRPHPLQRGTIHATSVKFKCSERCGNVFKWYFYIIKNVPNVVLSATTTY